MNFTPNKAMLSREIVKSIQFYLQSCFYNKPYPMYDLLVSFYDENPMKFIYLFPVQDKYGKNKYPIQLLIKHPKFDMDEFIAENKCNPGVLNLVQNTF